MSWRDWQHDIDAGVCEQAGCPVELMIVKDQGHFSMIAAQGDPDHPVNRAMTQRLRML